MQDEEVDQLFRSGLYDHEAEPAKRIWGNIDAALDKNGVKKSLAAYLSVAATILVMMIASWYFIPQVRTGNKKPLQITTAKNNTGTKSIIADEKAVIKNRTDEQGIAAPINKPGVKPDNRISKTSAKPVEDDIQSAGQLTAAVRRSTDMLKAVVPDAETPLSMKQVTDESINFKTIANVVTGVQMPQNSKAMAALPVRKRRVNSLGDLINAVVSKVDKREDKLIEFTNTDGDEATITGINLGFVKIKKEN